MTITQTLADPARRDATLRRRLPRPPRTRVRLVLGALYLVALTVQIQTRGIPLERAQFLTWIMGALMIVSIGREGAGPLRVLRDWVPLGVLLAAYDMSRGLADTTGMPVQKESLVWLEGLLPGEIATVWAQSHLGPYEGPARWWEIPVTLLYFSHFVVSFVLLGVLWARHRPRFEAFRARFFAITAAGLTTYFLLPAAPPWMASREGLIGPVDRVVSRGMRALDVRFADAFIHYGSRYSNLVAALPSLHAGWSAIVAFYLISIWRGPWRWLLLAYPLAMGVALVISGEHYIVDVVLGYVYALAIMVAFARWDRRRRAPDTARASTPAAS